MAGSETAARPRLTIGMACYEDFNGVYFTIQALQLYHPEAMPDVEIVVVDNHPTGAEGQEVRRFLTASVPRARYIAAPRIVGTSGPRELVFRQAQGDAVLCIDCHVLIAPGAVRQLIQFHEEHPDCPHLLHGPLVNDSGNVSATHLDPVWRDEMFGTWGMDARGRSADAAPFEIPMHGCGLMSCRRDAWVGFHPEFRGFGGEEGYIHEKFRQAGGTVLCLPFLRWMHRFGRPGGVPYPLQRENRVRNYLLGRLELGLDYDDVLEHFIPGLSRATLDPMLVELGLPSLLDMWFPSRDIEVPTTPQRPKRSKRSARSAKNMVENRKLTRNRKRRCSPI